MRKILDLDSRLDMYSTIPRGGVGAELGVCKGENAVQLYFRAKPSLFFLVDIWKDFPVHKDATDPNLWYLDHEQYVRDLFKEEINTGVVGIEKRPTIEFLNSLPDDFLDWVYIDSNHHYKVVSSEIDICLHKVKSGGYIMGHDFTTEPTNWGSSIIRAVTERVQTKEMEMVSFTKEVYPSFCCIVH